MLQMLFNQKMKQMPQQLMGQLERQLKVRNPQAYQEFQKARQNNVNPQEYLNKVVGGFNPQQRQEWNNMMGQFNQKQSNQNTQEKQG